MTALGGKPSGPFGSTSVSNTDEVRRIEALPRRPLWTDEAAKAVAASMTKELKTSGGTKALLPVQGMALYEMMEAGGLFGSIFVGHGKTLLTLLAPLVLEARRPVLLIPAALVEKTWSDRREWSEHFHLPTNLQFITYESLSLVQNVKKLDYILPDLIICDECFVAGTLVSTASGLRPIETIEPGDVVETHMGWYPVTEVYESESEDLYDVTIEDRRYVCTGGHPFLTTEGWKKASALAPGDEAVRNVRHSLHEQRVSGTAILQAELQEKRILGADDGDIRVSALWDDIHFRGLPETDILQQKMCVRLEAPYGNGDVHLRQNICAENEKGALLQSGMCSDRKDNGTERDEELRDLRQVFYGIDLSAQTFLRQTLHECKCRTSICTCGVQERILGIREGSGMREAGIQPDVFRESFSESRSSGESSRHETSERQLEAACAGRQRPTNAGAPTPATANSGGWLGAGEEISVGGVRYPCVFGGHGMRGIEDDHRSRRIESSQQRCRSEGCQEGQVPVGPRVARVTRVQRRSNGGSAERARVYNFHVAGPETYVLGGGEIVHNCQYVCNHRSGRGRRISRYMAEHPETKFVAVSGTVMKKSIKDFGRLVRWALKENAPIPKTDDELSAWAEALDDGVNPMTRRRPGALFKLGPAPKNAPSDGTVEEARKVFQSRLFETKGNITSSNEDGVGCSILVRALEYKPSQVTEDHFQHVRKLWSTPDGWDFMEAVELRRYLRQMSLGFWGVWNPRPPDTWLNPRKAWHSFARETLKHSHTLDTPLAVANAIDAGHLDDDGALDRWREVEKTFTIQPEPRWFDDTAVEAAAKWGTKEKGLIWVEHVFLGQRLAKLLGTSYYGPKGLDDDGNSIKDEKGGRPVIASIFACRAGFNLQTAFSTNLITACPSGASIVEQAIGRTHRQGQEADVVTVDIMLGCAEQMEAFDKAMEGARMAKDTLGHSQKLLLADVTMPDISGRRGPLWGDTPGDCDCPICLP